MEYDFNLSSLNRSFIYRHASINRYSTYSFTLQPSHLYIANSKGVSLTFSEDLRDVKHRLYHSYNIHENTIDPPFPMTIERFEDLLHLHFSTQKKNFKNKPQYPLIMEHFKIIYDELDRYQKLKMFW